MKYFAYDSGTLSNSAFHQQRNKLHPETFPFLFRQFNDHYPFSLYKEKYQLLACDGSSFTFTRNPKDQDSYFAPDGKTTNGYNQVHVVALFDLLSKRYCDTIVQPIRKKNEFQALADMIDVSSDQKWRCCCYAHIRRYFAEAIPKGKEKDYTDPAVQGFLYCNKLFEYERSYREKGLSYKQICNRRLKDQKPVVEAFLAWIYKQTPRMEAGWQEP